MQIDESHHCSLQARNLISGDWLRLLRGELNPMSAVISGKLRIKGEQMLLAQFQTWFQPPT